MVQLSVRMDPALRDHLRRAARKEGRTLQEFVVAALTEALDQRGDADRVRLRDARDRLATALASGAYADYVESIDDPDLRTE
jgi:uncharacterized protein (DUF1778 family)